MEISITNKLKKLDSSLIKYLITNHNNTITINRKYIDIYNIIKKGKTIYIDFKNIEKTTHIVHGLLYFDNKYILENILKKLAKYINLLRLKDICYDSFRIDDPKEKIIFWLKNNPQYTFDNLICKYF